MTAARQKAFPPGSPNTVAQLPALRRSLFGSPQQAGCSTAQAPAPPQETPRSIRSIRHGRNRIVSPPTSPRHRSPSRMSEHGSQGSRHNSRANSRNNSHRRPNPPELQEQLTQTVNAFVLAQARAAPACAAQLAPPEQPPADLHWERLLQPAPTAFPDPTEVQVQHIAAGLLTKLPLPTRRDNHKVQLVVSMFSDYPNLPADLANLVYQRANLLSIAVHHGWDNAIAALCTSTPATAFLPAGFQLEPNRPLRRQQIRQQPAQQQAPRDQPQAPRGGGAARGCGRGRDGNRRR